MTPVTCPSSLRPRSAERVACPLSATELETRLKGNDSFPLAEFLWGSGDPTCSRHSKRETCSGSDSQDPALSPALLLPTPTFSQADVHLLPRGPLLSLPENCPGGAWWPAPGAAPRRRGCGSSWRAVAGCGEPVAWTAVLGGTVSVLSPESWRSPAWPVTFLVALRPALGTGGAAAGAGERAHGSLQGPGRTVQGAGPR